MSTVLDSEFLCVRVAIAPLHAEPRVSSPQVSQRLAGHPLAVTERQGEWLRVMGEDDYEGWVHRGYVEACDAGGVPELARRRVSLGCVARGARPGATRALPFGARLAADELVESGEAVDPVTVRARFPHDPEAIAETAVRYFAGTPYQWGGVTPWGADCSGLVQSVFGIHGIAMPRDAWQQADRGADAGRDVAALQPADLLFFSERDDARPTHVGVSLGDSRMVHLALGRGGYAIEELGERADDYVRLLLDRFTRARRVR